MEASKVTWHHYHRVLFNRSQFLYSEQITIHIKEERKTKSPPSDWTQVHQPQCSETTVLGKSSSLFSLFLLSLQREINPSTPIPPLLPEIYFLFCLETVPSGDQGFHLALCAKTIPGRLGTIWCPGIISGPIPCKASDLLSVLSCLS